VSYSNKKRKASEIEKEKKAQKVKYNQLKKRCRRAVKITHRGPARGQAGSASGSSSSGSSCSGSDSSGSDSSDESDEQEAQASSSGEESEGGRDSSGSD
jgi:hypothetical protein